MTRRFAIQSILSALLVLAVLGTAACMYVKWQAYETRRNAEILLAELRKMKVGETMLDEVRQLAAGSQSRFLAKGSAPFCQDEFCTYTFGYSVGILGKLAFWRIDPWRLYLTPAQGVFSASLLVQRDRLVRIGMVLGSGVIPRDVSAGVEDEVPEISPVHELYVYTLQPSLYSAHSSSILVHVKPNATSAQREAAYSFDLKCIDKLGGCHSPTELLLRVALP
ncbi:MAG TPA: hypothetical protein VMU26_16795 [Candidatus Polarisedimenticolia bacterium]|nr:hypothetical protein [Candidatus Polarisedimenticolia bacterium]